MRQSGGPPAGNGCGSGTYCWRRLRDWQQAGVRDQSHEILLVRQRAADRIDWSRVIVDSSSIRGVLSVGVCLSLWQPQLIKSFGLTNFQTGLLSSVPFGVATIVMVLWGRSSDRSDERKWHTAIPLLL